MLWDATGRAAMIAALGGVLAAAPASPATADELTAPPRDSRIFGGEVVAPCGWPATVSIDGGCSGSLVHPQVVIYAAHCGDEVTQIRFGEHIEDGPGRNVTPELCETHPVGEFGFGTDFAFCVLPDPIDDVPPIVPLMGCETDKYLQVGQRVTMVGFGQNDDPDPDLAYGYKRWVEDEIRDFSWDEVFIGADGKGVCGGDSGGPALVQLDDGTWRVFGVTSWGSRPCGNGDYFSLVHNGIEWIEERSGFDVTPCHDALGNWDPGPDCGSFALDPGAGGGTWDTTCEFGPLSGFSSTCGDAFDPDTEDLAAPGVAIVDPPDRSRFDVEQGKSNVVLEVTATVDDGDGWGVETVELKVETGGTEVFSTVDPAAPFVFKNLGFTPGTWTLIAVATDRAGNEATSAPVVIGVDEDPPEPEPGTDTGSETSSSSTSDGGTTSGTGSETESSTSGDDAGASTGSGCGCRTTDDPSPLWAVVAFGALCRRRRRLVLAATLAIGACGEDDAAADGETADDSESGSSSTSTSGDVSTDETGDGGESTTAGGSETTGPPPPGCGNGILEEALDEICDDGNEVDGDGCNSDCTPSGEIVWSFIHGGPVDSLAQRANDLVMDAAGNLFVVGRILTGTDQIDAWIGKLDPDGELVWEETFPSPAGELGQFNAVALDSIGEAIAAGFTWVDFDNRVADAQIAKYADDGTLRWSDVRGSGMSADSYSEVAVDSMDNVIAVGDAGTMGDDEALTVRKYDPDGMEIWAASDDGVPDVVTHGRTVVVAPNDDIIVGGHESEERDDRFWLRRYTSSGAVVWTKATGDPLTAYFAYDMALDDSGDIVLCGRVQRISAGDMIVAKHDRDGDQVWARKFEPSGPGGSTCSGVDLLADGTIAIAGWAFTSDYSFEMWVAKLSADGDRVWDRMYLTDGLSEEEGASVVLDEAGDLFVSGSVEQGINDADLWVVKLTR